eukprot:6130543-Karenia_brevis.AAC.1
MATWSLWWMSETAPNGNGRGAGRGAGKRCSFQMLKARGLIPKYYPVVDGWINPKATVRVSHTNKATVRVSRVNK